MERLRCLNSCCVCMSLRLGAYLISGTFFLFSLSFCFFATSRAFHHSMLEESSSAYLVIFIMSHGTVSFASVVLMYGLCTERFWPLIFYIVGMFLACVGQLIVLIFVCTHKMDLMASYAAAHSFIFVAMIYALMEVTSLYAQWFKIVDEGLSLQGALD